MNLTYYYSLLALSKCSFNFVCVCLCVCVLKLGHKYNHSYNNTELVHKKKSIGLILINALGDVGRR